MLQLLKELEDPEVYFAYCLKIAEFGTKKLIPFKLNPIQKILHSMAERQLAEDGHVRIIVLKARRAGISTYIQGRFFRHAATNFNKRVHITTHSRETTQEMFGMARLFEQNYPTLIKPEMYYSGKSELSWGSREGGGLNSAYSLSTTEGAEVRGAAIDLLHCSEVASWGSSASAYATGLMNCVVNANDTEIWIESTAQGVGNWFYKEYWRADKSESAFRVAFFPWYLMKEYQIPFKSEDQKQEFLKTLGDNPRYGGQEEQDLLGVTTNYQLNDGETLSFSVTPENLQWRRNMIDGNCQGDLNIFHQEYPSTAREAFVASGRSAFDAINLSKLWFRAEERFDISPPANYMVPVNEFKDVSGQEIKRYYLKKDPQGELCVWNPPKPSKSYRMGIDVAEGILVDGRDSDYSVVTVLDAETYEECATWSGKIDPDLLSWVIVSLGSWYNMALAAVENNNHGLLTLKFLSNIHHYDNIYIEKALDERGQRQKKKLGFSTNVKTKKLILDNLRRLIREQQIDIWSKSTIDELQTFVIHNDGKEAAQSGSHDDRVMSLAIAAYMCHMMPYDPTPPPSSHYQRREYFVQA